MKATFIINQLTFELDAEGARELFQQVAQIQEIFEAETSCGCCQSDDIRYSYRVSGDFQFYELACRKCAAQFRFGQKKGTLELFPKRKDESGNVLPNGGWSKWEPRHDGDSRPVSQAAWRPSDAPSKLIPNFLDWDTAERSNQWGKPIRVDGTLFHIPQGKRAYERAPEFAQVK